MPLLRNNTVRVVVIALVVLLLALAALHASSVEGLQGYFASLFVTKWDTEYPPGFSDRAFRRVREGMTEAEVLRELPPPLGEVWSYDSGLLVGFTGGNVDRVDGPLPRAFAVRVGATKADIVRALGTPREKTLVYSRRPTDVSYHVRAIELREGTVVRRIAEVYVD